MHINAEWGQLLASSAIEYCSLIENLDQVDGEWLDNLASLLPRIHAAVCAIPRHPVESGLCSSEMDLDLRFELYSRLHKLLGEHDGYILNFDKPDEFEGISGSLADDFTDIYFELKKGLRLLGNDPQALARAVDVWYGGYLWHWGQHLVDAERHLYDLQVHRRLGSNQLFV